MNTSRSLDQTGSHAAALFRPDGWKRSIRIGAVVPHADVGPEAELQAMATDDITIHGSRLYFSAMRAGGEMDEKIPHNPVAFVSSIMPPVGCRAVRSTSRRKACTTGSSR